VLHRPRCKIPEVVEHASAVARMRREREA